MLKAIRHDRNEWYELMMNGIFLYVRHCFWKEGASKQLHIHEVLPASRAFLLLAVRQGWPASTDSLGLGCE